MPMPDLTPYGVTPVERPRGRSRMCSQHVSFVAQGRCSGCKRHFCDQCLVELDLERETAMCIDCAFTRAGIRQRRR